ncbi:Predicted arabinose efflux permease, MFS family [Brevibacterium sandarakinum]|uniref:Predicted arabinose efflux permease, MFS family n=1 Tax=Brevibacterium sandarakinum TaxID=629680 RepID=A0A1H1NY59_BRESA|nr:MFS transporter [Brevibacterium sandarakinum]SDS03882.1 Predicted arabinose efflux permease, MFS family [Brevibacterium sandarakinum]
MTTSASTPNSAPVLRTVAILVSTAIVGIGQTYIVLPLLSTIAVDLGTSASAAAWLATAFSLSFAAGFLLAGPCADRFGPRRVILIGLIAATASTAAVATAQTLPVAIGLRAVQGVTVAALAPTGFAYVADQIAQTRRPAALSALSSAGLAAAVLMQVAAQILTPWGWQSIFIASTVLLAGLAVIAWRGLRPDTGERADSVLGALARMRRLLTRPALLGLYAATLTLMGSFVIVYTGLELAGPAAIAGNPNAILILRASALPAVIAVPLLAGFLSRWAPRHRAAIALLVAGAAVAVAAVLGENVIVLALALLVFVGGIAAAAPAIVELIHQRADGAIGASTALYTASMFLGTSIGPQIAALLQPGGFTGIGAVAGCILAIGALLVWTAGSRSAS